MRAIAVVAAAPLWFACAAPTYHLNIPVRPDARALVHTAVAEVEADRPPDALDPEARLDALALQSLAAASAVPAPDLPAPVTTRRDALAARLAREILAVTWPTTRAGAFAVHEVTVGLVDLPFDAFLARFSPAADWGRHLSGYRGGELVVDERDDTGRALAQRERMVLASPVGAPDVDIDKYEQVDHGPDEIRVRWTVTFTANDSSPYDTGWVLFRRHRAPDRERTLVAFDSVHRINTTWIARLLTEQRRRRAMQDSLRRTFSAHVERYREVVAAPRP